MKRFLRIVALSLIISQLNLNYATAGKLFFSSDYTEKEQKIIIGYKIKWGGSPLSHTSKLAEDTAGDKNLFDAPELGTIAFLIILMLILTAGRGTAAPSSTASGGGTAEGAQDSKLEETVEEIQAAPKVSEADIPSTNVPVPTE